MAKLFKDNVIKEKLLNFEIPDFDEKIKIINNWLKLYKDSILQNKKEEELEGPFGDDFFGKILGYESLTENEIYSRKFQPKVPEGGQKEDIGLGIFGEEENLMKVIVELKDAKTSLDKPQQRAGNLTPVQQAFKYKPYFKECDFIIVSNFYETRLYIDSYYDYESFTLENLANPNNNYFEFRKFYFLLTKNNLISKNGESKTKSLLSTIRTQEKEITKKFYKEYSELRMELLRDLRDNNSINGKISKEKLDLIFEKAQKIIDRIVFIHFCEDINDLLPNGKLKENLLRAEEIGFTPWDVLKIFFKGVDKGSEKLGIPDGYNGGLFAEDKELDNLKVGDEICKKFIDLGEYDFANDLSVNILGHIFEQSISDMEEIKNKINIEGENNIVSKRKKDGIFYTPEYIVDYIVKNSVGKKIDDWEDELKLKHNLSEDITDKNYIKRAILVYSELQEKVQNIKVLDPACGSGAFLVKVFDFLLDKNKEIAKKLDDLNGNNVISMFQTEAYFKDILQNNIYGVDLNEESVEITKLSLWLKTAQKGKKLTNLDNNIKCGNSLIDDIYVAGDKAFKWEEEFPDILKTGRIFVDRSLTKLGHNKVIDLLKEFRLKPYSFNIDGRFNKNNPDNGDINDWYKNGNTPYRSSMPGKGIIELEPTFFGTNFDNISIRKTIDSAYLKDGSIAGNGGITLNINGGNDILTRYLNIFEEILGKDLINKNINDFLILLNTISQKNNKSHNFSHSKNGIIESLKFTDEIIIRCLITDDESGIFSKINRQKIYEKLKFKIINTTELQNYLNQIKNELNESLGGFDVIVGNPPYGVSFSKEEKKYLELFDKSVPDYEIYVYFISLGKNKLLNRGGLLSYIFPNTFLSNLFGKEYRKNIIENNSIYEIVDLSNDNTFEDASVRTCIFSIKNSKSNEKSFFKGLENNGFITKNIFDKNELEKNINNWLSLFNFSKNELKIIEKIKIENNFLKDFCDISQGLIPYDKYKGHTQEQIKNRVYHSNIKIDNTYKQELKGADISRYGINWNGNLYISYGDWLAAPREPKFFQSPRILIREIAEEKLLSSYTDKEYYNTPSIINIISKEKNNINLLYIITLLNSKLIGWYSYRTSPKANKGLFPKILINDVRNFPIKNTPLSQQQPFIEKADFMLDKNKELQEKINKFLNRLKSSFGIEKLSTKLENFYLLDFGDFVKELQKHKAQQPALAGGKIKLSLKDQDEWEDYFASYKKEILELKSEIDNCDKEIDEMVFDLYGLDNEERRVVLGYN